MARTDDYRVQNTAQRTAADRSRTEQHTRSDFGFLQLVPVLSVSTRAGSSAAAERIGAIVAVGGRKQARRTTTWHHRARAWPIQSTPTSSSPHGRPDRADSLDDHHHAGVPCSTESRHAADAGDMMKIPAYVAAITPANVTTPIGPAKLLIVSMAPTSTGLRILETLRRLGCRRCRRQHDAWREFGHQPSQSSRARRTPGG